MVSLWNDFHSLQLRSAGVLGGNTRQDPNDRFVRRPFIGHFEVPETDSANRTLFLFCL